MRSYDEASIANHPLQRAVGAENTASVLQEKHFGACGRKPCRAGRTARSSRNDVIEWIAVAINLGGIAEACLSSHLGRKAFCFSSPLTLSLNLCKNIFGG